MINGGAYCILAGFANSPYDNSVHRQHQDGRQGERDTNRQQRMYDAYDVVEIAQFAHEMWVGFVQDEVRNIVDGDDGKDRSADDLSPSGSAPGSRLEWETDSDKAVERDAQNEQDAVRLKGFEYPNEDLTFDVEKRSNLYLGNHPVIRCPA